MTNIPDDLLYTKDDEWLRVEDQLATVGITDYAQDSLSDIVYVELPDVGDKFEAGETFGVVESVKAASDLFMPIAGEVVEVNEELADTPETINEDPYGGAWMVKIRLADPDALDELLSPEAYQEHCDARA
jgi:glycine cleavage system H protein